MKFLISAMLAASTLIAPVALPSISLASTQVALACPANAPDAWKRAGGYCEQIESLDTIGTERGSGEGNGCETVSMIAPMLIDGRVHVASLIDPCCKYTSLDSVAPFFLPQGILPKSDAIENAEIDPCNPD